jgi:hypothetical protein
MRLAGCLREHLDDESVGGSRGAIERRAIAPLTVARTMPG